MFPYMTVADDNGFPSALCFHFPIFLSKLYIKLCSSCQHLNNIKINFGKKMYIKKIKIQKNKIIKVFN